MKSQVELNAPNEAEIRDALARLLDFSEFKRSPRLASFLKYIIEEALGGRGESLRAYTVATAVFERDESFDPHNNSIVRVEATRLRKALKTFYTGAGAEDRVKIEIPLGGYMPYFTYNVEASLPAAVDAPGVPEAAEAVSLVPQISAAERKRFWIIPGAAAAAAAVLAGVFVLGMLFEGPAGTSALRFAGATPVVAGNIVAAQSPLPIVAVQSVQVSSHDYDAYAVAGQLQRDIANAISRFDEVKVQRGFSREPAGVATATDYELRGQIDAQAHGAFEATFRLLHSSDHRIVWSGAFNIPSLDIDSHGRSSLVRSIVTPIAQPYGVIINDMRSRIGAGALAPKSAECIALFEEFWESRVEMKRRAAFDCVNQAIPAHPNTAQFLVILSNLYIAEYLGDLPRLGAMPSLDAAEDAAQRSIRIAPGRAHPYLALSQVLNLRREYDKALRLAERAQEINPFDTDVMAQLGALYILRGKLSEGSQLLHHAMASNPSYPAWMNFYLFLDGWLRDDKTAQQNALAGIGDVVEPDAAFARVIAAADTGNLVEAKAALARLRTLFPAFAAAPKAALERLTLAPAIVDRMMASAGKVGL